MPDAEVNVQLKPVLVDVLAPLDTTEAASLSDLMRASINMQVLLYNELRVIRTHLEAITDEQITSDDTE